MAKVQEKAIHMDFEKGLITAFHSSFPGVDISGCEFHWKSCLRKRIAAEGLMVFYNTNIQMQQLVRLIWALVYVPSDYIILAWETVILGKVKDVINNMEEDYNHELEAFIKYVDSTWIGERNARTQQRKKPSYPHEQWNKFKEVVTGEAKTNNVVEGFNNGFASSLPARATDWIIIDRFKMEESLAKTTLHQAAVGNNGADTTKSRSLNKKDRDLQLASLVKNFHNLTLEVYMESLLPFFE
jgi:hypothetical protein